MGFMPGCGEADEEKGGGRARGNLAYESQARTDSRIVGSLGEWSRRCRAGITKNSHEGVLQSFPCTAMLVSALPLTLGLLG